MTLHIVILAAGIGSRMNSNIPKVLHTIGGKPMLEHVVDTAFQLSPEQIHIIVGHQATQIQEKYCHLKVNWILQQEQLGTGHAVKLALAHIPDHSQVLVLYADVPLISPETLLLLINYQKDIENNLLPLGLLLTTVQNPHGLGRIIRDDTGQIHAIVEEKDANASEKNINEIYTGICSAAAKDLKQWLPQIKANNQQKEYYLTEIVALAVKANLPIRDISTNNQMEIQGVNNKVQLNQLERFWQQQYAFKLMNEGVTIADVNRIDIRGSLECAKDVFIDVNNIFKGKVTVGENTYIASNCVLNNVSIGNNCEILSNSVLEDCEIGDNCKIGPFARIRTGTKLENFVKIGNFVETKKAIIGSNTKANHLSYLGDVIIGNNVNIGAGTITCNYDGKNKHQTNIENGAFIGSGTQIVAPVSIGENATIGAGSTIRKNVADNELAVSENKQKSIAGWGLKKK